MDFKCKCGGNLIRFDLHTYVCPICGLKQAVAFAYLKPSRNTSMNASTNTGVNTTINIQYKDIQNQQCLDKIQENIILNAFRLPSKYFEN